VRKTVESTPPPPSVPTTDPLPAVPAADPSPSPPDSDLHLRRRPGSMLLAIVLALLVMLLIYAATR
jgi:hypothetical protein